MFRNLVLRVVLVEADPSGATHLQRSHFLLFQTHIVLQQILQGVIRRRKGIYHNMCGFVENQTGLGIIREFMRHQAHRGASVATHRG